MSKYKNASVVKAKVMLVSRLSYVLRTELLHTSARAISQRIGMSAAILSKIKRNIHTGISFDALLELAQRLDVKYKLTMEWTGGLNHNVEITLENLYTSVSDPALFDKIMKSDFGHKHH